jgi:two-component system phosphate regulon sensor histidine kinase PhoR
VSPILDKYAGASNFGSLAVAGDVTELRKLENLRKDFVANVSHEFRTPLTLISGFVEMFKMGGRIRSADRRRAFEIIEIETERLKRLVSELLTLSEIENALPLPASAPIDAEAVIEGMVGSLGSLAERKRQRITTELRVEKGALSGNENWFYQAVKNLLENAIKYTPEGGSIRIEAYRDGGEVVVSVADTGIGIAPEELERIFERFYRVEKARGSGSGGSGLGLALVKDIASIFGGRVLVRSELGAGSVFTLRLPAAAAREKREERENGGASGFEG